MRVFKWSAWGLVALALTAANVAAGHAFAAACWGAVVGISVSVLVAMYYLGGDE